MLQKISFTNYKLFKNKQTLALKPITVLIGKNSSGKSSVAKLLTLISASLSGNFDEPLRLRNEGVELGSEFKDLVYGRNQIGHLTLEMESETEKLKIVVGNNSIRTERRILPIILSFDYNDVSVDVMSQRFKGFVPQNIPFSLSLDAEYIGPFRKQPERWYEESNSVSDKVGIEGENAYSMLIVDALTTENHLVDSVSQKYQENFEGWGIQVNQDNAPPYQIELFRDDINVNLKDVGQGISQTLPLIVRALKPADTERLIIIEQPELHLHPAAHGNLAQIFVESTQNDPNKRYLIETHAPNFVLRLRRLIAKGTLNKDNVALYFVDFDETSNESTLKPILIDHLGRVDYWPENVFSETLDETIAIRDAQLNQRPYAN